MDLVNMLKEKLEEFSSLRAKLESLSFPEGRLWASQSGGKRQYYLYLRDPETGKRERSYLRKSDLVLSKQLAQKAYVHQLLVQCKKNMASISGFLRQYRDLEEIYQAMPDARKELVEPIVEPWELQLQRWLEQPRRERTLQEPKLDIFTKHQERVRSKSEKIIADSLAYYGIPYRYEAPLLLNPGNQIHPDFTCLSPKLRQEVYWEHHGKMDDPEYVHTTILKLLNYERHGIFPGERLIMTFESRAISFDSRLVDSMIRRYLLKEECSRNKG